MVAKTHIDRGTILVINISVSVNTRSSVLIEISWLYTKARKVGQCLRRLNRIDSKPSDPQLGLLL